MNSPAEKKKKHAKFVQTLVDADFPALILLTKKAGKGTQYFFASAITDEEGDLRYYFAVSAKPQEAKKYFRGRCDLRYLFVYAPAAEFYTVSLQSALTEKAELELFSGEITEDLLPEGGFFASDHTNSYFRVTRPPSSKSIAIDGEWRMAELKDIYSKYADLYSFVDAVEEIDSGRASQKCIDAFKTKPFHGGSSYLAFFGDLRKALPTGERASLESVQWASPGTIKIRGVDDIFENVDRMVERYLRNANSVKIAHDKLRTAMRDAGFLEIQARSHEPSSEQAKLLFDLIEDLKNELKMPSMEGVSSILEGNIIVKAKISLAVFRRISALSQYFMSGRAAM